MLLDHASKQGKQHELHDAIFRAYYGDARKINDDTVLVEIAASMGLDPEAACQALYSSEAEQEYERGIAWAQSEGKHRHTYTHAYSKYTHIHKHTCIRNTHTKTYTCIYRYTNICTYTYTHTRIHIHKHTCIRLHIHIRIHIQIHIHLHIHIYTPIHKVMLIRSALLHLCVGVHTFHSLTLLSFTHTFLPKSHKWCSTF